MVVDLLKKKDLNKEQKNIERMTEWFKVTDCKSVRFFPKHRFESYFFQTLKRFYSKYDAVR